MGSFIMNETVWESWLYANELVLPYDSFLCSDSLRHHFLHDLHDFPGPQQRFRAKIPGDQQSDLGSDRL
ncbi:hypothetical protein D3C81_937470 [compost metagenome]